MELRSATGQRFNTTSPAQIFMRARDGVNVSGGFLIVPKTTGLQRLIKSVGQEADRGNIIVFRSSRGTIFNAVTGNRIVFERGGGVQAAKPTHQQRERLGQVEPRCWLVRASVRGTCGNTTCDTRNRACYTE